MKRIVVVMILSLGLLSCSDKDEYMEIGCECQWEKKTMYMGSNNGLPTIRYRTTVTPSSITDCGMMGVQSVNGTLICNNI